MHCTHWCMVNVINVNRRLTSTCMVTATEVWQPLWQHHTESLPRSLIRDPLLQQTPIHGVVINRCCQPRFISTMSWFSAGVPLVAKRTIHGSHSWSGGTMYSNTICLRWSGGTSCGGGPLRHDSTRVVWCRAFFWFCARVCRLSCGWFILYNANNGCVV